MRHDNTLRFCSVESSITACRILKRMGALEIRDNDTKVKGGKKFMLNGEIFFVYAKVLEAAAYKKENITFFKKKKKNTSTKA